MSPAVGPYDALEIEPIWTPVRNGMTLLSDPRMVVVHVTSTEMPPMVVLKLSRPSDVSCIEPAGLKLTDLEAVAVPVKAVRHATVTAMAVAMLRMTLTILFMSSTSN
jgi:hypothetical protein